MGQVSFDRLYRYAELSEILQSYAAAFPHLVQLASIGRSYEGRDIWLLTITNRDTGPDRHKPALWVDGNIHATELAPSTACLYLLDFLTRHYGRDPDVTRCLDSRTFYICPRVNSDGAELALADRPKFVRSSTRPYPGDRLAGGPSELQMEDIDGDGRILWMRVPDPNGAWKVSDRDPRLLVRRDPIETGGTYYRLLPEGRIDRYDGATIATPPPTEGLDLNRNFPMQWRPEPEQTGAGNYPTSEPETRAIADFIAQHPNLNAAVAFHTFGGLLLRPYSHATDTELPQADWLNYRAIGQKGTELTDYPATSVFEGYCDHPKNVMTGAFDDWCYEERGLFAWTVELWNLPQAAGVKTPKLLEWLDDHPIEEDLALLKWNDEVLDGRGYVDWYAWEHPQLGKVELGGWNQICTWRNPPAHLLEREIERFPRWLLWQLLISPRLEVVKATAQPLGDRLFQIEWVVQNTGWLPTNGTQKAIEKGAVQPCRAAIALPSGAELVSGQREVSLGHLAGRSHQPTTPYYDHMDPTDDRARVVWLVRGEPGTVVDLTARGDRSGWVQRAIVLPDS